MKKTTLLLMLLLAVLAGSCLKNEELPPPRMTLTQAEGEILDFSTIQSADVTVHLESGEVLKRFTTSTYPMSSWTDTIIDFDGFTHRADIDLSFRAHKGLKIKTKDSLFEVTYKVFTEDSSCTLKRKLRYRFIYPQLDSFDIKVASAGKTGKCFISIDNREAYTYNEAFNKTKEFDLVYVNETDPNDYSFGTALVSPDASYLQRYFQRKLPSMPIYDSNVQYHTDCGIVISSDLNKELTWKDFNSTMLGDEENVLWFDRINVLSTLYGVGAVDLQPFRLYKFRLHNGRYIMVRILSKIFSQYTEKSEMELRVYLQQ